MDQQTGNRIAVALERIADALERQQADSLFEQFLDWAMAHPDEMSKRQAAKLPPWARP